MKIVFAGFGELGDTVLGELVQHHEVCAVVTHQAGFTDLSDNDVEKRARVHSIPTYYSVSAREPELHEVLTRLEADLLVSTNWRTRMPAKMLGVTRLGAINVHDALLPEYAGFGAVNWAIRDGRDRTGLTVHFMDDELDTGPVINQVAINIGPDEYADSVYTRLVSLYGSTALRAIELVEGGSRGTSQTPGAGFFGHRITANDTRIDWNDSSHQIVNLVRSQASPFINAWCVDDDKHINVTRAAVPSRPVRGTAGRIVAHTDGGILVSCGRTGVADSKGIILLGVKPEGTHSPLPAVEYFGRVRGARYLS